MLDEAVLSCRGHFFTLCCCCPISQPCNTKGGPGPPPSASRSPYISGGIKRWTDPRHISRDPLCPALPSSPRSRNWSLTTWRSTQWPRHQRGRPSWVWRSLPRRYIYMFSIQLSLPIRCKFYKPAGRLRTPDIPLRYSYVIIIFFFCFIAFH